MFALNVDSSENKKWSFVALSFVAFVVRGLSSRASEFALERRLYHMDMLEKECNQSFEDTGVRNCCRP